MTDAQAYNEQLDEAVACLNRALGPAPPVAVVAGTGLGSLAGQMRQATTLPYGDLPGFPVSTVSSHAGQLVAGALAGRPTLVFQGRWHLYEGYGPDAIVFPLRAVFRWGVQALVVTNAAGGLNRKLAAGDLMLITDHINALGASPLSGPHHPAWGPRFPDMSQPYDAGLRQRALALARELSIPLHQGVYVAVPGPQLETPAETRFYRAAGADAIGMSTVLEVIAARQAAIPVLGFSVITNVNDPDCMAPATLEDIVAAADRGAVPLARLITALRETW